MAVLAPFRRDTFRVKRTIIRDHVSWLVSGESVLIVNVPIDQLPTLVSLLFLSVGRRIGFRDQLQHVMAFL